MNMPTIETKLVKDITGTFHVPPYQRGYRWGEYEVGRLLEDINENGEAPYCLQPIVVKRKEGAENEYELIDGQQRLTTLYLIYLYMFKSSNGFLEKSRFNIDYDIKSEIKEYLEEMPDGKENENIDYYFLYKAYQKIKSWFDGKNERRQSTVTNFNKYFDENVKVIWYEPEESEDSVSLFTRLNIGKIPLTNAELVKALFLKEQAFDPKTQNEIALQWDLIETELHNKDLWYFLTKGENTGYQTRIDLVLDLIAEQIKKEDEDLRNSIDKYVTFFCFAKRSDLKKQWEDIYKTFLQLKDWYEDRELYHKIGYLIASESCTLKDIYELFRGRTKTDFKKELDERIKESVNFEKDYTDLSYENSTDCKNISKLLLLFNVESVRRIDNKEKMEDIHVGTQRFPFRIYKAKRWSLEHIHAQHSESLNKQEEWKEWLRLHKDYVEKELEEKIERAIAKELTRDDFEKLHDEVLEKKSVNKSEDLHDISNLALLAKDTNSALSNSLFCVKRKKVIEYDNDGECIPLCTKRVFLKYYTKENNQFDFWGPEDRKAYIEAINEVLKDYLNGNLIEEDEG